MFSGKPGLKFVPHGVCYLNYSIRYSVKGGSSTVLNSSIQYVERVVVVAAVLAARVVVVVVVVVVVASKDASKHARTHEHADLRGTHRRLCVARARVQPFLLSKRQQLRYDKQTSLPFPTALTAVFVLLHHQHSSPSGRHRIR